MLVPRELHVQNDPIAKLTGEQIGEYLEILKQCVEDRRAAEAKVRKLSTGKPSEEKSRMGIRPRLIEVRSTDNFASDKDKSQD